MADGQSTPLIASRPIAAAAAAAAEEEETESDASRRLVPLHQHAITQ